MSAPEDTHHDIADQAEARPLHEQAGKPTRNCADDNSDDECCQHGFPPWLNDGPQSSTVRGPRCARVFNPSPCWRGWQTGF